jgi:glycosyltransferase involved in cell wall biosynthesis
MPAYQAATTIAKSIKSIQNQSWQSWELWVVVDAATDETGEIAIALAAQDSRIHLVISARNRGVTRARNLGIRLAKGTYLAFCDADDWWTPDKLQSQLWFLKDKKGNFCYTAAKYVHIERNWTSATTRMPATLTLHRLKQGNPIGLSTALFDVQILGKHYFEAMPKGLVHEDYAYWIRLFQNPILRAFLLPEATTFVRIYSHSRSSNKWLAMRSQAFILRHYAHCSWPLVGLYLGTYLIHALYKRGISTWYQQLKSA